MAARSVPYQQRTNHAPMDFAYENENNRSSRYSGLFPHAGTKRTYTDALSSSQFSPSFPTSNTASTSMNPFLFHSTDAPAFHSIPSQPGPEVEMNTATPPSAAPYGIERPFGSDLDISKEDDEARQEDSDATPTKRRGSVSTTSGSAVGAEGGRVISDKAVARITRTRSKSARQRGQASAPSARRRRGARQDAQYSDEDDGSGTDDDEDVRRPRSRSLARIAGQYLMPPSGKTSRAELSHMEWPEVLLGYAQFLFNASLLLGVLYLLYSVIRTVQLDVAEKVHEYELEILSEIGTCAASYQANHCASENRAPALAGACTAWERCMTRDPSVVGRARVTAETFAEILNGFVDVVSWKSMLFSLLTLIIVVGATNSTLSFFRLRSRTHAQQPNGHAHTHVPTLPPPPVYYHPVTGHPHAYHFAYENAHAPETPPRKRLAYARETESTKVPEAEEKKGRWF